MSLVDKIVSYLPDVAGPTQRKLAFKEKLKWTLVILVLFFVLGLVPLFGLGQNALQRFEFLSMILGAEFGSIISLGIGPIVTASIVLQLLHGSGLLKLDHTTSEGKRKFNGMQKILAFAFVIFEACIYVLMGGLAPAQEFIGAAKIQLQLLLIVQLVIGGILIIFMDEVVTKWGFGSGISLFIAAGVSKTIFVRALSPFSSPTNPGVSTGAIPALFQSLLAGDPTTAGLMLATIVSTVLIFVISVYIQAMKIEIPLSFGRIRGHGIRWPLRFIYTSNIPVILIAALIANVQLFGKLLSNWGHPWFGQFGSGGDPISGVVLWMQPINLVEKIITSSLRWSDIGFSLFYMLVMVVGAVIFSYFWVQTSGMDARSQAKNIMQSGLQIPGFRKDPRIMERLLQRYINPLTIMGAIAIGVLAALADISGALTNGTGILLTVMIIYNLYEEIAKHHMMDMHPALRKFMQV